MSEIKQALVAALKNWDRYEPFSSDERVMAQAHAVIEAARPFATLSPAAVAEREPVALPECVLGLIDGKITLAFETPDGAQTAFDIIERTISDPLLTSELEAENARLKVRLAEAMKALEPFAAIEWADEDGWSHDSPYRERVCDWFGPSDFRTARRVREGGKVDV